MFAIAAMMLVLGAAAPSVPAQRALQVALREAIAASCPGLAWTLDADLTRAAAEYALAVRDGRAQQSGSALAFYAGLWAADPAPYAGVAAVSPPENADRAVGDLFPHSCKFTHAGVAAMAIGPSRAVVALLTSVRAVALEPIPGRVAPGARVRIAGRLGPGLSSPRLYALAPGDEVRDQNLPLSPARRFSAELTLRERGEHVLEVLADGPGGPQVLALRRVFAGVEPPLAPPAEPVVPEASGAGAAQHPDELARVETAIAVLRVARGLPRLSRDAALDAIAEGHSRAMASARTFAHVLATDGAMTDRLRKAGYAYRSAGENIGLAADAVSAHEAVVASPAHLANLLDPRHRRLGLGEARGPSPDGGEAVYLTEILAAPVVGSRDPSGEVLRLLEAERGRLRLPSLEDDHTLDAIALSEVRAISLGAGLPARRGLAAQRAIDTDLSLRSAAADLVVGSAPVDAISSSNLRDPDWTKVGVGAIYASSPQYGPGRLWVLIVYGK